MHTRITDFIAEKLVMKSDSEYEKYAQTVANYYEDLPTFNEHQTKHWDSLNESNKRMFKILQSKYRVEFTEEDPYPDAKTMKEQVERTKVLKIWSGESSHPYFSVQDNLIFRAVHDYYTHILTDVSFGLRGEYKAYNTHCKILPPMARPALFTEVIGQVSYQHVTGRFPTQKVAIMEGFDFLNVGVVTDEDIVSKYEV